MHGGDIIEGVVLRAELIGETVSVRTAVSDESLTVRQLAYEWHVERDKKLLGPQRGAVAPARAARDHHRRARRPRSSTYGGL